MVDREAGSDSLEGFCFVTLSLEGLDGHGLYLGGDVFQYKQ